MRSSGPRECQTKTPVGVSSCITATARPSPDVPRLSGRTGTHDTVTAAWRLSAAQPRSPAPRGCGARMAADDGARSVAATRGDGPFQQLMTKSFQGELLHIVRFVQSRGRPKPATRVTPSLGNTLKPASHPGQYKRNPAGQEPPGSDGHVAPGVRCANPARQLRPSRAARPGAGVATRSHARKQPHRPCAPSHAGRCRESGPFPGWFRTRSAVCGRRGARPV
jgi:hypothetical protein